MSEGGVERAMKRSRRLAGPALIPDTPLHYALFDLRFEWFTRDDRSDATKAAALVHFLDGLNVLADLRDGYAVRILAAMREAGQDNREQVHAAVAWMPRLKADAYRPTPDDRLSFCRECRRQRVVEDADVAHWYEGRHEYGQQIEYLMCGHTRLVGPSVIVGMAP